MLVDLLVDRLCDLAHQGDSKKEVTSSQDENGKFLGVAKFVVCAPFKELYAESLIIDHIPRLFDLEIRTRIQI